MTSCLLSLWRQVSWTTTNLLQWTSCLFADRGFKLSSKKISNCFSNLFLLDFSNSRGQYNIRKVSPSLKPVHIVIILEDVIFYFSIAGLYVCSKCNRSFASFPSFDCHQDKGCDSKPAFFCKYCPYASDRKYNLLRHLATRHDKRQWTFSLVKKRKSLLLQRVKFSN